MSESDTEAKSEIVSLDQYRQRATVKHGDHPVPIDEHTTVVLRRPMRMSSDERKALFEGEKRMSGAQQEHKDVRKARRNLKAAQDRHEGLDPEKTTDRVRREHERRVDEAQAALDAALEANPTDQAAQVDEVIAGLHDIIRAIADSPAKADKMLDAIGDDVYVLQEILADWRKKAEPGEAQPSQS